MQMTIPKIKVWLSFPETFKYEGKIITCLISNIEKPRALRQSEWSGSSKQLLYHLFHTSLIIPSSLCVPAPLPSLCSLIVSAASPLPLPSGASRLLWSRHFNHSSHHSVVRFPRRVCGSVELSSRVFLHHSMCCCGARGLTDCLHLLNTHPWQNRLCLTSLVHTTQILLLRSGLLSFVLALIFVFMTSANTLYFSWHSATMWTWKSRAR